MSILGSKPKRTRTRKTWKEKIDDVADKALLDAIKHDEKVRIQYIKKRHGIDIPPTSERMISQVIEQAKLRVVMKVAGDIAEDPDVQAALRDKLVAELLGVSPHQPTARETDRRSQRPNIESRFEQMRRAMQLADKYKEFFGVNTSSWSKALQDPEVMKAGFGLIQGLLGSFGLPQPTATADGNGPTYAVEINGAYVEMDRDAFAQYVSKKKVLESPAATPIQHDQKETTEKPVAAKHKPKFWLPPISSAAKIPEQGKEKAQEVVPQPTSVPPNAGDSFKVCVAKIVEAMDRPVEEFVQKTVASCQSGDKESLQIRDFLLAHIYDDVLKELSRDGGYIERFEKNRLWYDQVREALRTQL